MTIPKGFKPMLSGTAPEDLSTIKFPVLVSPKLDGIRCVVFGGVAYSRKLKPLPNRYIQKMLSTVPDGYDGELIVGSPVNEGADDRVMQRTSSGVMSEDGEPRFTFHVFDWLHDDMVMGYGNRLENLKLSASYLDTPLLVKVRPVHHYPVGTVGALMALEQKFVEQGYEGIMIRSVGGQYKFGRSTTREGGLLKLKRFLDAEGRIIGFIERLHNANEATKDALGHTKRSTHKDGKVPMGTLGSLECVWPKDYVPGWTREQYEAKDITVFEIGTGFTDAQRQMIWNEREGYRGSLTKMKYQELTPTGAPRFPVWLDFRSEIDT